MSFKFGLNVKNKAANALGKSPKPALGKKKPLFDGEEESPKSKAKVASGIEEIGELSFEDILPAAPQPEKAAHKPKNKPIGPPTRKPLAKPDDPTLVGNTASAQDSLRRAKEAEEVDATIYDYDAAYDAIHARTALKKAADKEDAEQQKSKYMDGLFESAELRKKDQLRARDKLLQREREAEGDEFADKDKFVTGAYKAQQEETRKAEAEEKLRQEAEEQKKKKFGMLGFHKQMLMEEEKRHQEAMDAAAELAKNGGKLDEEPKEKTDIEIARELQAQGKNIALNEEGQVADKRQLLSAGLNIVAKPKKIVTAPTISTKPTGPQSNLQGRNAARADIRARHTQMVAEQIEKTAKRKADEDAEEQRKIQHASKSQKSEGEISSAKERYLQRKKAAAEAKAAASGK
jgi:coiled-coil domain-containing protein 55